MNVLFIGDVIGKTGRQAVKAVLPRVRKDYDIDFVIANGENSAGGFGITAKVGAELFGFGIDVLTSGNHIWDKKEAFEYLSAEKRVLRPLNYPPSVPGFGSIVCTVGNGGKLAVINLVGRVFMPPADCPFRAVEAELERLGSSIKSVIIDIHAEATSEKLALGYFLDGKVSAVFGTHTHVQTADEQVFSGGTAYITDVGMTGPEQSVIGIEKDVIIERFLSGMPVRFEVAKGPSVFSAVAVSIDEQSGNAREIHRIFIKTG